MCWSSASSSLAGTLTAAAAASLASHAPRSFSAAQLTTLRGMMVPPSDVSLALGAAESPTAKRRQGATLPVCLFNWQAAPHLASGPSLSMHSCRPRPLAKSTCNRA